MCSEGNRGRGNRGKGARQGSARPDGTGAATVGPALVTAAVPRDLRIDPCEKKKSRERRPAAPWSIAGRSRGRGS